MRCGGWSVGTEWALHSQPSLNFAGKANPKDIFRIGLIAVTPLAIACSNRVKQANGLSRGSWCLSRRRAWFVTLFIKSHNYGSHKNRNTSDPYGCWLERDIPQRSR